MEIFLSLNIFQKKSQRKKQLKNFRKEKVIYTLDMCKSRFIPRNKVDEFINDSDAFITNSILKNMILDFEDEFEHEDEKILRRIKAIVSKHKNPFVELKTEHKRFAVYKEEFFFIEPEDFNIGFTQTPNNQNLNAPAIETPITAVYLSLEKQLQLFFELPGIIKEMDDYTKSLEKELEEGNFISNFVQAELWQTKYKKMYEGKAVIPVTLFFDDFDTGNCLGSHAGSKKFGGVYIQLLTLPPHLKSKLTNVFVNTIFYSDDRKNCSNESVFRKAIEELNILNTKGFKVNIDGKMKTFYLQCVLVLGDNLGLNQCCGFEGGFNAKYYVADALYHLFYANVYHSK